MPEATKSFKLKGSDGETHDYYITAHMPLDAQELMIQISMAAGKPISRILESNALPIFKAFMSGDKKPKVETKDPDAKDGEGVMNTDIEAFLRENSIEFTNALDDLGQVMLVIARSGLLVHAFKHVVRDNHTLDDEEKFNAAYMRNYSEQAAALVEIVRFNGWLDFLFGLLPQEAMTAAKGVMSRASTTSSD